MAEKARHVKVFAIRLSVGEGRRDDLRRILRKNRFEKWLLLTKVGDVRSVAGTPHFVRDTPHCGWENLK